MRKIWESSRRNYDAQHSHPYGGGKDGYLESFQVLNPRGERNSPADKGSWELNTKILPILWQALAVKPNLTHLTIRFPTTRVPKPTMTVPSIPNLTYLRITDIDPLCYPDDISLILYGSKKLQDLTLHWNSHMREAREPSVTLSSYFGKVIAADERLPLRKFTVQNLYVHSNGEIRGVIDMSTLRECTIINCMDGHGDNGDAAFIDTSWLYHPSSNDLPCLTMLRVDSVSKAQGGQIAKLRGIEKIYMIGPRKGPEGTNASHIFTPAVSISDSPASGPQSATTSVSDLGTDTLAKHYIDNIIRGSGTTLLHLLLKPQWRLSSEKVATIVRHCPNLEQIGIGVEFSNFEALQLLMPFLSKLHAVRILDNPNHSAFSDSLVEFDDGRHEEFIRRGASISEWSNLRWVGLGNLVFELGPLISQKDMDGDGSSIYRRSVTKRSLDEVRHVEIWGMDSLDI